ncbi:MAG: EAL domain-containing protein, partial [Usitatibacteraceae bacterium]
LMRNLTATLPTLDALTAFGIRLSVDDFGTGYSSLSYLRRLPIDTLKIDASFVRELQTGSDNEAIVAAIIAMAKSLNLRVIAEGVETHEQMCILHAYGCHIMQGYYFSRPVPAADFAQFRREYGDQKPLPRTKQKGNRKMVGLLQSAASGAH